MSNNHRVTARGEDILAWTKSAITRAAKAATAASGNEWHVDDWGNVQTGQHETVAEVWPLRAEPNSNAQHIALNNPESVLRRCAADRKILELHSRQDDDGCRTCVEWSETEYCHVPVPFPCDTFSALAEGYGWTEGER